MIARPTAVALLLGGALVAHAQLSSTGPFSGALSDGFESYPDYSDFGGGNASLGIMGGGATFTSASGLQVWIYDPSNAGWGLGSKGSAPVNSGTQGLGLYNSAATVDATLSFSTVVSRFGGYFNCVDSEVLSLQFFDAGSVQIGSTQFVSEPGVPLVWFGWKSTIAIKSIRMSGGIAPVMDDLQADPVPEPASLAALGLGALALLRRRRKA